ncbi:MAG: mRNA interferase YafQ [Euryarchaeota archaeon]|nr:mRNA interferase YafQ [Euryarchaeota archaeon]
MSLILTITNQFKKDIKKIKKQNKNLTLLKDIKELLITESKLPVRYNNHQLIGNYAGHYELHIQPDWLLIYKIDKNELRLVRTGSHSELF